MTTPARPRYIRSVDVAKLIRKMLRNAFGRSTAFSVVTDKYSGVSTIFVRWTDGPTEAEVSEIVGHMHGARFDGMTGNAEWHTTMLDTGKGPEEVSLGNDYICFERIGTEPGRECGWCTDGRPGHGHFTVKIYEGGRCIGRMGGDGSIVVKKIYAPILSEEQAIEVAEKINSGEGLTPEERERGITARVDTF